MKKFLLLVVFLFLPLGISYSQVSNLIFWGQTGNFSRASGDTVSWSYNVPNPGDTTLIEFWIDADGSGTINTGDVLWNYFIQIDGDSVGSNGPPDIDGKANGSVSFKQKVGLAPGKYVALFKNHGFYTTRAGVVTALVSPTFTISGHITVPTGYSSQNIVLDLLQFKHGRMFWTALTDASGNFTISMDSDTSGNPWGLIIDNGFIFGASVISPDRIMLTLDKGVKTSYTGNNFTVTSADAEISGTLRGEDGNPFVNADAYLTNGGSLNRYTKTDTAGVFHLGLLTSELPQTNLSLGSGDMQDTTIVSATYRFANVTSGNKLTHDLTIFKVNSTITGQVTFDNNPGGPGFPLWAENSDTGQVQTFTGSNGNFKFYVSNKIFNYKIQVNIPQGYSYNGVTAHAGDTNVKVNLTTTDVKQISSDIPKAFALLQNFPNPFNPATQIQYDIPKTSYVHLVVYNLLGQQVKELVSSQQAPGKYSVTFDGAGFSSGIYIYSIQAGSFAQSKKLILLK